MSKGSRLALWAALGLAACAPRKHNLGTATDAGALPDAAGEAVDLGPPCVAGGTSAAEPATVGCTLARPGRIVVSGDHVYWTVQGGGAVLMRAPLAGGGAEPLAFDNAGLRSRRRRDLRDLRAAGARRIMRVPVAGGAPVALATKPRSAALPRDRRRQRVLDAGQSPKGGS